MAHETDFLQDRQTTGTTKEESSTKIHETDGQRKKEISVLWAAASI